MKALILAAGMGTRLGKYTKDRPKGMLTFKGKTLIERQIELYRNADIDTIIIATGYRQDKIQYDDIIKCHNAKYDETNMVESLVCARDQLDDDVLISYADLLFSNELLQNVLNFQGDIGVAVDKDWERYWAARYGDSTIDTESLLIKDNQIVSLGEPDCKLDDIDARYIGIIKMSKKSVEDFLSVYDELNNKSLQGKWRYSKNFKNAYMTDMIQELIDRDYKVGCIYTSNGWLEFDTEGDYELYQKWSEQKNNDFIDLEAL